MSKNTLYITFDGLSDPLGQSQILPYLCGIAKNGYRVHILSCEKKDRLESEKSRIEKTIGELPITWQFIHYDSEAGFFSRLIYVRKIAALANSIARKEKISLVHCRSYLASLAGLSLKRKKNIPFVFDMRGFWADERLDGGIWKKSNFLQYAFYRYFKKKEKCFLEESDAIVSLTLKAVTELEAKFPGGGIEEKTTVIPCCTDTQLFDPDRVTPKNLPALAESDHTIIYTGSIGTWYYTKEIIDCVLSWRELIPAVKLLFVTRDTKELKKILENYSAEEKKTIVTASTTYSEVPGYLAAAKAAIFFIKPAYSKMASSPTKMAECWAMDLPVITNPGIGDNDYFFQICRAGVMVNGFTREEYLKAGKNYLSLVEAPNDYRSIALKFFDNKLAVQRYTGIYNKLSEHQASS